MLNRKIFICSTLICSIGFANYLKPELNSDKVLKISDVALHTMQTASNIAAECLPLQVDAKNAAMARLIGHLLGASSKTCSFVRGDRGSVSLGLHLNKHLWDVINSSYELKTLSELQKKYGNIIPLDVLKEHYNGVSDFDKISSTDVETESEDELKSKFPALSNAKICLYLLELALHYASSFSHPSFQICRGQQNYFKIGESMCSLLLHFLPSKKFVVKNNWLKYVQGSSHTAAAGFDIGMAIKNIYNLSNAKPYKSQKTPNSSDLCCLCGQEFGKKQLSHLGVCHHWFCKKCTDTFARETVIGTDEQNKNKKDKIKTCRCPICKGKEQPILACSAIHPDEKDKDQTDKDPSKVECMVCCDKKGKDEFFRCPSCFQLTCCLGCHGKIPKIKCTVVNPNDGKILGYSKEVTPCPICKVCYSVDENNGDAEMFKLITKDKNGEMINKDVYVRCDQRDPLSMNNLTPCTVSEGIKVKCGNPECQLNIPTDVTKRDYDESVQQNMRCPYCTGGHWEKIND